MHTIYSLVVISTPLKMRRTNATENVLLFHSVRTHFWLSKGLHKYNLYRHCMAYKFRNLLSLFMIIFFSSNNTWRIELLLINDGKEHFIRWKYTVYCMTCIYVENVRYSCYVIFFHGAGSKPFYKTQVKSHSENISKM